MAAVYSGYTIIENYMVRKPYKEKALRSFKEKLVRILVANVWLFHNLGLESYPQHELAKKQMTGFGGMVTFFIKGDLENAKQFFKSSKV